MIVSRNSRQPTANAFSLQDIYSQPPSESLLSKRCRQIDNLFNQLEANLPNITTNWYVSRNHCRLGHKDISINYIWIISTDNKYVLQIG